MTVEYAVIYVCLISSLITVCWSVWQTTRFWKALDQRSELANAISEESLRRARTGDVITYHHLFGELHKVRLTDHTFMLATFRDPYKLYPSYIRRLVGK